MKKIISLFQYINLLPSKLIYSPFSIKNKALAKIKEYKKLFLLLFDKEARYYRRQKLIRLKDGHLF